jgi:hypothetical protein
MRLPPGEGLTQQSEQGSEVTPSRWAWEQPEQHPFGVNQLQYWPRQSGHPGQRLTQLGQQLLQRSKRACQAQQEGQAP